MNISNIADFADLIVALGVIGSLLFLAIQVRSDTNTTRNQFYESHRTNLANTLARPPDREVAKVIEKGWVEYDSLDEDEKIVFGARAIEYLSNLDGIENLGRQGILRPEIVEMADRRFSWFFAKKGTGQWFRHATRHPLPRDWEQKMEKLLSEQSPRPA